MTKSPKKEARRRCPYEPDAIYSVPHAQDLVDDVTAALDAIEQGHEGKAEPCWYCGAYHPERRSGAGIQAGASGPQGPLLELEEIATALKRLPGKK